LVSSADSDFVVDLALYAAQLTALGAAMILGSALTIRRWMRWQESVRSRVVALWRPILTRTALEDGALPPLPPLRRRHVPALLDEWNAMHDALRGAGTDRLNELARRLGLRERALELIRSRDVGARILAMRTMGHLRDGGEAWALLTEQLASRNTLVSFYAAAAMLQVDAQRAMPEVVSQLARREKWPGEAVARLLREAGTDIAREPLRALVMSVEPARVPQLLPWLGKVDAALASEVAARILHRQTTDVRILAAALAVLQDASLLPAVRPLVRSPDFVVRKNLASAIGRLGGLEDAATVVELMGDKVWWVRYRAAQALTMLRGMTRERLAAVRGSLRDRFARDMLDHVTAEGTGP
jgi:HEAT repeat protein